MLAELINLQEADISECDPNVEDCTPMPEETEVELLDNGMGRAAFRYMGYFAILKTMVPGIVAWTMTWWHMEKNNIEWYDDDDDDDGRGKTAVVKQRGNRNGDGKKGGRRSEFYNWWKASGFSEHTTAWWKVDAAAGFLWGPFQLLWVITLFFGWLPSWTKFYIEHLISNLNWVVYIFGLFAFGEAIIDDGSWQSVVGTVVYFLAGYVLLVIERRIGTVAIRYLDPNWHKDELLRPSLLYIFGIIDHEDDIETEEQQQEEDQEEPL